MVLYGAGGGGGGIVVGGGAGGTVHWAAVLVGASAQGDESLVGWLVW